MDPLVVIISAVIFLGFFGLVYFLKSKSANVALASSEEQQKNAVPPTNKRGFGTWMKETLGTKEGATEEEKTFKKRALLMVLFIFTVTLSYVLDDGPSKLIYLGLIVIGVFHVYVLWVAFIERNISDAAMTWAAGWFIILVAGWALPGPMWQTWDDTKKLWRENKDDPDLFKKALGSLGNSSRSTATRKTMETVLNVTPGDMFRKVNITPEKVIENITWSCSNGCITKIVHEGALICNNGMYQSVYCGYEIVGETSRGIPIYSEQFKEPKGVAVEYPTDLIHVIYSFGTISEFGDSEVKVTAVVTE